MNTVGCSITMVDFFFYHEVFDRECSLSWSIVMLKKGIVGSRIE